MILLLKITGLLVLLKAFGLINIGWLWVFSPAIVAGLLAIFVVGTLFTIKTKGK